MARPKTRSRRTTPTPDSGPHYNTFYFLLPLLTLTIWLIYNLAVGDSPASTTDVIKAAKYVHGVEVDRDTHRRALASLHVKVFGAPNALATKDLTVTTSQSEPNGNSLEERVATLWTSLHRLESQERQRDTTSQHCVLDANTKKRMAELCRTYNTLGAYDWQVLHNLMSKDKQYLSDCTYSASALLEDHLPHLQSDTTALRAQLPGLAAVTAKAWHNIQHEKDLAYAKYNESLASGGYDWQERTAVLGAIRDREQDIEAAARMHDTVKEALEELEGQVGCELFLRTAERALRNALELTDHETEPEDVCARWMAWEKKTA